MSTTQHTEAENKLFSVFDKVAAQYEPPKEEDMIYLDAGAPQTNQQEQKQSNLTKKQRKYEDLSSQNQLSSKENTYNIVSTCDDSSLNHTKNNKEIVVENLGENVQVKEEVFENYIQQQKKEDDQSLQGLHLKEEEINNQYKLQKQKMEQKIQKQRKLKQQKEQKQKQSNLNNQNNNNNQIKTLTKEDFKYKQQNKVTNILQDEEEIGEVGEMIGKTANQNLQNNEDSDIDSDQRQLQKNEDDEFDAAFEDGQNQKIEMNDFNQNQNKEEELNQNQIQQNIFKKEEIERQKKALENAQKKANQKIKGNTTELGNRNGYMVNKLSNKAAIIKANDIQNQNQQNNNNNNSNNSQQNQQQDQIIKIDPKQIKEAKIIKDIQENDDEQIEEEDENQNNQKNNQLNIDSKKKSIDKQDNKETEAHDEDEEEDDEEQEINDKVNSFEKQKKSDFNYNNKEELIMSPEELRRRSSEKKKKALTEDEWDKITKETLQLQQQQKELQDNNQKQIQYIEAYNKVKNLNLTNYMKQIHSEEVNEQGFFARLFGFCSKTSNKLNRPDLLTERDRILAFSKVKYDDQDSFHFQMIYTIYCQLSNTDRCLRYGNHWEEIGFQGTDPATDIRGGGMLGILQILAFVCKYKLLLQEALEYSQQEEYSFPLCCTLLNLSVNVINLLKQGKLNDMINQEKSVINIMNLVYFASFHHLFSNYKRKKANIEQLGFCIKETKDIVDSNPSRIVNDFKKKIDRYYKEHDF